MVQAHTSSILMQFQHIAACNGLHAVEARMARSDRRGLIEIDRGRLEQASCECYDVMRRQTDQIVPDGAARPAPACYVGRCTSRWLSVFNLA